MGPTLGLTAGTRTPRSQFGALPTPNRPTFQPKPDATIFLCITNTARIDSDTEISETRAKPNRGRLLSPDSSPLVRCPRQRCALLPKQKHSGARRMVQAEGFGWQRCAASADLGGAAAAGVLQEEWRQETGAKGGASRLPLTFCLLRFRRLYLGKFPQTPLCNLLPTPYPLLPKPKPLIQFHK